MDGLELSTDKRDLAAPEKARWDEKASLHGMRYAPIIDVLEAQEKGDRL